MSEGCCSGVDRREQFERSIDPEELSATLKRYQKFLGKNFGITELLELEKIRAMALIAEAINDAPEFLMDQLGKARHDSSFHSISDALASLEDAIRETHE